MSAENRLTDVQLAALQPDDLVAIETGGDFRRPRQCTGRVVRITSTHVVVSVRSDRGVPYVHRFGRRDGVCTDGTRRSELVNPDGIPQAAPAEQRRQAAHVDALYREWKRDRDDEALQRLHAAIGDYLAVRV